MAEKESGSFPKLNGVNYHDWRFNMEWTLKKKKLWRYVDGSTVRPEPSSANVAEVQRFNEQSEIAQAIIVLAIEPLQQQHVRDCESARDVWLKLEAVFEPKSRPRMMQLTRALIGNKCAESEPMEDYVKRTRRLAAQLKEAGLEFKDDQLTTIMIANLPSSYDSVAAVILNWDERKYAFDNVKEALLTEYCRRQQQAAQRGDATEALATKTKVSRATVRKNTDWGAERRRNIVCFGCRKTGHIARQCPNKSAWQVQKQAKDSGLNVQLKVTNAEAFILDSGATRHICNSKDWFSKFRATAPSSVYSADDSKEALVAEGVGTVEVTLYCGTQGMLNTRLLNVFYVPKCRRNLISVSSLEKTGHYVVIKNKLARIYNVETKALIAEACARDGLYVLRAKNQR
uniref:CCHC-type domain-containing protein n=1 Tax=Trichuris muris TaxID=70415 RepID=A0A5S6QJZ7_TRIMR